MRKLNYHVAPISVDGTIDEASLDLLATVSMDVPVRGKTPIGIVDGCLKDGVSSSCDLSVAKGTMLFYLKNEGRELWLKCDLAAAGTGKIIQQDQKIADL